MPSTISKMAGSSVQVRSSAALPHELLPLLGGAASIDHFSLIRRAMNQFAADQVQRYVGSDICAKLK